MAVAAAAAANGQKKKVLLLPSVGAKLNYAFVSMSFSDSQSGLGTIASSTRLDSCSYILSVSRYFVVSFTSWVIGEEDKREIVEGEKVGRKDKSSVLYLPDSNLYSFLV